MNGPRIDGPSAMQAYSQVHGGSSAKALEGEYRGEKVQGKSVMSMVADAMEELPANQSERTQSKRLAERSTRSGTGGLSEAAMELYRKFLQAVPDLGQPDKLNQLAESIKKGQASPQQLREQLRNTYDDVSHQFTALQFLEEMLTQQHAPEDQLASVREARRQLDQESGPEIRAGLNVARDAVEFAQKGTGSPQELRNLYRDMVLRFEDPEQAFEAILQNYGKEKFDEAAEFLIRGVGNDMNAMGPSRDMAELHAVNKGLKSVQMARNLHMALDDLLGKMQKQFGIGA